MIVSKLTAIFLNGWILPNGGAASERVWKAGLLTYTKPIFNMFTLWGSNAGAKPYLYPLGYIGEYKVMLFVLFNYIDIVNVVYIFLGQSVNNCVCFKSNLYFNEMQFNLFS